MLDPATSSVPAVGSADSQSSVPSSTQESVISLVPGQADQVAPPVPEVSPEELDELARQVEATVFGSGKVDLASSDESSKPEGSTSVAPIISPATTSSQAPPSSLPPATAVINPFIASVAQATTSSPLPPALVSPAAATTPIAPPLATPSAIPSSPATPASLPQAKPAPQSSNQNLDQKTYTTILDVLVEDNLLSPEQLDQLKREFLISGRAFEDILIEKAWLSEEILTRARAKFNHLPFIAVADTGISPEAMGTIEETVARRYGVLPFAIDKADRTLSVAMKNPLDLQAVAFVEQKTGYRIIPYFASATVIDRIITERYAQSLSAEVDDAVKDTNQTRVRQKVQQDNLTNFGGVIRDAPINRIVETILEFAIKSRASDIHIEPLVGKVRVRYRIDGILVEKLVLPKSVLDAVVSRIKILSNLKIDEKRMPQDGRFNYVADQQEVDLRVSTLPTVNGEKINLRLLQKNASIPTLEQLGMSGLALAQVKEAIKVPHGIILISGPTGSGKTTTLYSIMHIINTPKVNILTLEDPVEYQMTGVNQVQINPKAGLTFASGMRSFLRQDPNIIMIGEMRDSETTELAIQASLTGHLVFSTIHTSSAAGTLPRMIDMGAENFLISSSLTLVIAQRVVRIINPDYKEEYTPEPVVVEDIKKVLGNYFELWCKTNGKDPNHITLYRPAPNLPENETEYKGRMAIFEVMKMTDKIGKLVMENRPASEIEAASVAAGMLFMKQDGYIKVLEGKTTLEEILRVAEI